MKTLKYASTAEAQAVTMLIEQILNDGHNCSVFDGEIWEVKRSTDFIEILSHLSHTDGIETVRVRNSENLILGELDFLFQGLTNAMEVLCDYQQHAGHPYLGQMVNKIHNQIG